MPDELCHECKSGYHTECAGGKCSCIKCINYENYSYPITGGDNMEEQELQIPDGGGNYLTGEYAKTKRIENVKIVEPKPRMAHFDDGVAKVQVSIEYEGQKNGDPDTWTMNVTTARAIRDVYGLKPSAWIGKTIPIEISKTQKGYAIYADTTRFTKKTEQEVLQ